MLHLATSCRYFLYQGDADMRKGFDSLSGIVSNLMRQQVLTGDVFVFLNRKRNHIKLLHWEGDGFALYHKRLERGRYERPVATTGLAGSGVSHEQLLLMLQGISLKSVRKLKRYQHPAFSRG
jgi:transposase